jgi:lysozyme
MKIIITEQQYDNILQQVNKTIGNITDPYKMVGIQRPSQKKIETTKKVKPKGIANPEPQKISGKQLMDGSVMNITNDYKKIVREWEGDAANRIGGVKQPKLVGYLDSRGIPTIGYGHTDGVRVGMKITKKQAEDFLVQDSGDAIGCIRRIMDEWKKNDLKTYKLTQGQFDAMVSMTFNAGCTSMRKSRFIQELKKGNTKKAAELVKTFYIGTTEGLANRREQEYNLFIS